MSIPDKESIKTIANLAGYYERRTETSNTLFFQQHASHAEDPNYPNLINVFYTTQGVMTKIKHPRGGYNELWRSDAYNSMNSLRSIFENPRIHTGRGYRNADQALRGCAACGTEKRRTEFSNNQWRKGTDSSKCKNCVAQEVQARQNNSQSGARANSPITHRTGYARVESPVTYRTGYARVEIPVRTGYVNVEPNVEYTYRTGYINVEPNPEYESAKERATRWTNLVGAITCDAQGCSNIPEIRCNRCEMAYYCSERCKRRHLDEHLDDLCRDVYEMRETNARCKSRNSSDEQMKGWALATALSGNRSFKALLAQAQYIHQADEHWDVALGIYNDLMMREQSEGSAPEWRQVFMGASRCFYEKRIYDGAIEYGTVALEMNRMFPQSHKYIALSQRDSGDLAAAIRTMKEAVLYEAPYDDENKQLNVDLLWEMQGN